MPQALVILAVMTGAEIASGRLRRQLIEGAEPTSPADVVRTLLAVQGQDYLASLWAVALRTPDATERAVEASIARRELVRTWPMRGTLHLVAAADARWMTELLAPKVIRRMAARHRQLGLDEQVFDRGRAALTAALQGDRQLTRPEANKVLEAIGIPADARRNHIFGYLSQRSVLCIAARHGKQPTFALLEEWAPAARSLPRQDALAQLTLRYFGGHGPATEQDLMWWSGLTATEVRAGIAMVAPDLVLERAGASAGPRSGARPPAAELRRVPARLPRPERVTRLGPRHRRQPGRQRDLQPARRDRRPRPRHLEAHHQEGPRRDRRDAVRPLHETRAALDRHRGGAVRRVPRPRGRRRAGLVPGSFAAR
jgi:hypothetical protein